MSSRLWSYWMTLQRGWDCSEGDCGDTHHLWPNMWVVPSLACGENSHNDLTRQLHPNKILSCHHSISYCTHQATVHPLSTDGSSEAMWPNPQNLLSETINQGQSSTIRRIFLTSELNLGI
mmetsp:Transcript_26168/g.53593  ORF Transcript_26168/g.53593 Transcript_26168/m.53593 type:complete len:120 (-) Transcript_26168:67-426(-)